MIARTMDWIEVVLPAGALAEEVAALLADEEVAAAGVEIRGEDIVVWAPAGDAEPALAAMRAAAARIAASGLPIDPAAARVQTAAPEDEWRDAWKRFFRVARLTPRIVIVPSWETHEATPGDVVLDLDPGRAFGTGAHASTRLCLSELDALAESGRRVASFLDVGTGSGILAIAAAKLWPGARGVAVDVDPLAVSAARENLERNGVAGRVAAGETPVGDLDAGFDLVVANIQADVLEPLAAPLAARVAAGGVLVLSGLLAPQADRVAAVYARRGLEPVAVRHSPEDRDWAAVVLRRPA
jgi:ribosomal protein L11 methyltransferase